MTTEADTNTGGDSGAQGGDSGATDTALSTGSTEQPNTQGDDNAQQSQQGDNQDSSQGDSSEKKQGSESDDKSQNGQESKTPTEYSDFTLPENMEVSDEVMGEFKGLLGNVEKELGQSLSQETAQKFADMGANIAQEAVESVLKQQTDQHAERVEKWIDTFKNDPQIGGTEEKQQQTLAEAKRVVKAIGGDALMDAINETGAGNHPEIIRAFHTIKDIVGEDGKVILSNQGGGSGGTLASRLYPDQKTAN